MKPTRKLPLFCITGASGVGKSTLCEQLFINEKDYIVLESDIWWHDVFNTPADEYANYRARWMSLCAHVSQIGLPCVLCGSCTPWQFEKLPQRALFTEIHYLAVVCDDADMEQRMREGRKITDEGWISSSVQFNRWLKENGAATTPAIALLDTTHLTPAEAAAQVDRWIRSKL